MSCILLATLGSLGDLHPYIAVGKALAAHGRHVRLATSTDYRARVEAAGLEFAPLAPSLAELGDREQLARRLFARWGGARRLIETVVTNPLDRACADLAAALEGAILAVSHPLTPALPLLAEQRGIPWLSSVLAPYGLFSTTDPAVIPGFQWLLRWPRIGRRAQGPMLAVVRREVRRWEGPLHALRALLKLPAIDGALMMDGNFSPRGTLALFDPVLAAPQADWPVETLVCGAALHDGGDPEVSSATSEQALERFLAAGPPPVVFGLGSAAVWMARDYWRHAIAACVTLGVRGLLLTGMAMTPVERLPDGIAAFDYLPYSRVFARAAAIVHQAGAGTLAVALRSARPQLLMPAGFDQPDNAARAARLGVGRILPFRRAHDSARLVRALQPLLADSSYERAAVAAAARIRTLQGAAVAAERILQEVPQEVPQGVPRAPSRPTPLLKAGSS